MGPVESTQRKGRLPQYARNKLVELQEKFDQLENFGVFKRPEDVPVSVEYLNPYFPSQEIKWWFPPSLMADVDSTLRHIAQWKHLVAINLTSAF